MGRCRGLSCGAVAWRETEVIYNMRSHHLRVLRPRCGLCWAEAELQCSVPHLGVSRGQQHVVEKGTHLGRTCGREKI
ncbi:hypothetical protein J6590_101019 [Homalodisca vitripennis]|nr:hypothetical protein J6590_101019 [Homalodisca vitripennis]